MNCEQYTDFYERNRAGMPGLIPPGKHPVCTQSADYLPPKSKELGTPPPPEPGIIEMAGNFASAVAAWISAGAPVVSEAIYRERSAICDQCPYWDGSARLGLGKCNAPGCGCTKLKRWLATAECPLRKWLGIDPGSID